MENTILNDSWRYLGSMRCPDRRLPLRPGVWPRGMGLRSQAAPHHGAERRGLERPLSPAAVVTKYHQLGASDVEVFSLFWMQIPA